VKKVERRAVTVDVNVGHKVKTLIARKEHIVRMEGS
jgi:ribosomal protein L21E